MPKEPLQPVAKTDKVVEEVQDLITQEQFLAKQAEKQPPKEELLQKFTQHLPRLIQKTLAKLEASQVYQTFKLPGRDYVVRDQREKAEAQKTPTERESIAAESKKPLQELLVQRGKLIPAREKGYENYLGEVPARAGSPELKAARQRIAEFFSRFEQTLLKRFEGGEEIVRGLADGQLQFLKKTLQQWQDFFARFARRTVLRKVAADQIQEMIFRGLVQRQARATLISDLSLTGGQLERFARHHLSPEAQNFAAMLAQLSPGQRLNKDQLRRVLAGEMEYLAIRAAEEEQAFAMAPAKGKFLATAQAEEKVAHDLGLQMGAQLREKEKVLRDLGGRRKGPGSRVPGPESEEVEQGSQFIPWWQYGPLKKFRTPLGWFLLACLIGFVGMILFFL